MVAREDQWPAAFSLFESRQPIADFAGRTLGAASFGLFSWLPFAVNAVSCLTSTASLAGVRASRVAARPSPHESGKSGLSRHLAGFHWLAGNPFLRGTLVVFGTTNVIFQIVILLVIVSIIRVGQPPWVVGAVLAATGIGGVIGSSVAPSAVRRFPPHAIIAAAVWAWTIPMMLIAISSNPYVLAAAWLGVGMVGGIASVAQSVYMAGAVPDSVLARVNGSCAMVSVGLVPFGALLGGYLLDEWGPGPVRWLLPIAMTVLAIWATRKAVSTWSKTTQVSAPSQR